MNRSVLNTMQIWCQSGLAGEILGEIIFQESSVICSWSLYGNKFEMSAKLFFPRWNVISSFASLINGSLVRAHVFLFERALWKFIVTIIKNARPFPLMVTLSLHPSMLLVSMRP